MSGRRPRKELEAEIDYLRRAIRETWWMARRYVDGRMTYAVSLYNEHTRALLGLGIELKKTGDGTLWARDGMGRAFDGLTEAEAAEGDRPDTIHRDEEIAMLRNALPDPSKLLALAEYLDALFPDSQRPEVQADLRAWAQAIYQTDPARYRQYTQKVVLDPTTTVGSDEPADHPYQRRGSWSGDDWCAVDGCTSAASAHPAPAAASAIASPALCCCGRLAFYALDDPTPYCPACEYLPCATCDCAPPVAVQETIHV